jgi:hypothetical protein
MMKASDLDAVARLISRRSACLEKAAALETPRAQQILGSSKLEIRVGGSVIPDAVSEYLAPLVVEALRREARNIAKQLKALGVQVDEPAAAA